MRLVAAAPKDFGAAMEPVRPARRIKRSHYHRAGEFERRCLTYRGEFSFLSYRIHSENPEGVFVTTAQGWPALPPRGPTLGWLAQANPNPNGVVSSLDVN